jgi:TusA-related sulfurtransferase
MRKLQTAELLEIVGDDVAILEDMPVWCERAGHRLVEMVKDNGRIRSLVEKGTVAPRR